MNYEQSQMLIKLLFSVAEQLEGIKDELERHNENFEKCVVECRGNTWFKISADVQNN